MQNLLTCSWFDSYRFTRASGLWCCVVGRSMARPVLEWEKVLDVELENPPHSIVSIFQPAL